MPSDYLCNLVVPGAAKSGTSSLHEYLDAHPMISMSSSKVPHHFSREEHYTKGPEAHNSLFYQESKIRYFGESSTSYLPWHKAAERVKHDLKHPKAIIVLRHPVDRCFSHYRWRYRLGLEKRSFFEAVYHDGFGYDPDKPTKFGYMAYLEFSRYARHCTVWEGALGAENCLFLSSDALRNAHDETMNRCFSFLGVPELTRKSPPRKINSTDELLPRKLRKLSRLARIIPHSVRSSRAFYMAKKQLLAATVPSPPNSMTDAERIFVEEALSDDIAWFDARFLDDQDHHRIAKGL